MNRQTTRWVLTAAAFLVTAGTLFAGNPYIIQEHYRWRNDDGSESGASWKAAEDTAVVDQPIGENIRLRFSVSNHDADETATEEGFNPVLRYSTTAGSGYSDVPKSVATAGSAPFAMTLTSNFATDDPTTEQLTRPYTWQAGKCVESPTNRCPAFDLLERTTEIEFCFMATTNAVPGQTYHFRLDDTTVDEYTVASAVITIITPPTVENVEPTDKTATSITAKGIVTETGGNDPTAYIYWGPTDGTTNKTGVGAWSNAVNRGVQSVEFSTSLTGLLANKEYFYRCYATNLAGDAWAESSTSFTTELSDVSFSAADYLVSEGDGTVTVTVNMDTESATQVSINVATANGTAAAGSDYTNTTDTLIWTAGQTGARTVEIPIIDDVEGSEGLEEFTVSFSQATNCTISGASQATVIIEDNDGGGTVRVQFSGSSASGAEELGSTNIMLSINPAATGPGNVAYTIVDSSTASTNDFSTATNGTITINTGATSTNLVLAITDDSDLEVDETVVIQLSNPSGLSLGLITNFTFTIEDSDPGPATVTNYRGASAVRKESATLWGEITDNGRDNPIVHVYWGPSDGTTNKTGAWAETNVFSGTHGVGTFSTNISGLSSGLVYYYRCYVTNAGGEAWASASDSFTAEDPPSFNLLANSGFEIAGATATEADSWNKTAGPERKAEHVRTGSYSAKYPQIQDIRMYGVDENELACSWNGQYDAGGTHPDGGVRPGFKLAGTAYTRAETAGGDSATFGYGLTTDNSPSPEFWMVDYLSHNSDVYAALSISNAAPLGKTNITDVMRPVIQRTSSDTAGVYYVDDATVTVSLPRLELEVNPTNITYFPNTLADTTSDTNFGARCNGGADGTVLYGANGADLLNPNWNATAWSVSYDPSGVFSIADGATLVSTNATGVAPPPAYQYTTVRFSPTAAGTYTGVVRIATTDPNDWYPDSGGKIDGSIVYESYVIIGTALAKPLMTISDVAITEADTNVTATFTVSLSPAAIEDVSVTCTTSNGTAIASSDYTTKSQQITIPSGSSSETFSVTVLGDDVPDGGATENFYVNLTSVTNATLSDAEGVCTITDDEFGPGPSLFLFR